MRTLGRAIAFILVLATHGVSVREVHAGEWNIGLKRLALRDPVSGGTMAGLVTYPTAAAPKSLTIGRFRAMAAEDAIAATGRFPLVILSHGTGALPDVYLWLFAGLTK